jgi:surface polysaccharide O-acyltransferase-like enzyme
MIDIQGIIEIYSWVAASFIMIFITAIAMFYQKKFNVKTFYYFYIVPIIVLLAASTELFATNRFLHESIELSGALSSFLVSFYLYRKMVGIK